MKSKQPHLAAIFFVTIFLKDGGGGMAPLGPSLLGSSTETA